MKSKILVAREIFPEVLERLRQYFEVEDNQADAVLGIDGLKARLADKAGALTAGTDPITPEVLAAAPGLKAVCNFAVGYNNIDLAACTRAGVMATNTPGVLDDTTADLAWALLMATARRLPAAGCPPPTWMEGWWPRWPPSPGCRCGDWMCSTRPPSSRLRLPRSPAVTHRAMSRCRRMKWWLSRTRWHREVRRCPWSLLAKS